MTKHLISKHRLIVDIGENAVLGTQNGENTHITFIALDNTFEA